MLRLFYCVGMMALISMTSCLPAAHYRYNKKSSRDSLSVHPRDSSYLLMKKFADLPDTRIQSLDEIMGTFHERGGMIAGAANSLLGYAVSAAKTVIANEKGKYTANTTYGNTEDYFYAQPSLAGPFDPSGMQFTGFDVVRTILREDGRIDTALFASFDVDTSKAEEILNNFVFRLKLTKFYMRYVKPKVAMFSSKKMSVEFNISFLTSLITPDGNMKDSVVLGKFHLLLNNISIRLGDPDFGLCKADSKKTEKELRKARKASGGRPDGNGRDKGPSVSGKAFIVPRSYGYFKTGDKIVAGYNQGSYSIVVSMKECTNPNFTTKIILDNGSSWLDDASKNATKYLPASLP